jgi:hypothetical protein
MSILSLLECAQIETPFHIIENAVSLSCGHLVCKSCVSPSEDTLITCKLCGKLNRNDLSESAVLTAINEVISHRINDLFQIFDTKYVESFEQFKQVKKEFDEKINEKFDSIKWKINERLNQIKLDLDKIGEDLLTKLKDINNRFLDINQIPETRLSDYEKAFADFKRYFTKAKKKSNERFFNYQRNYLKIERIMENMKNTDFGFSLDFLSSDFEVIPQLLGKIDSNLAIDENTNHLRVDFMRQFDELAVELNEKTVKIKTLTLEKQNLSMELEKLRADLHKKNLKNEELNHKIEDLTLQTEQIYPLKKEEQELLLKIDNLTEKSFKLSNKNEDLIKIITNQSIEIEKLTRIINKQLVEMGELKEKNQELAILIQKSKQDLLSLKSEKSTLSQTSLRQAKTIEYFDHLLSFPQSGILTLEELSELSVICELEAKTRWKLLYRASQHGFSAQNFHSKCNDTNDTLTIILTENEYIFGGFTTQNWSGHGYKSDPQAFLFSFNRKLRFPVKQEQYAIYAYPSYGPCFGGGREICIYDQSNINELSYSNFPYSYQAPDHIKNTDFFLAGASNFKCKEIEVFSINKDFKK